MRVRCRVLLFSYKRRGTSVLAYCMQLRCPNSPDSAGTFWYCTKYSNKLLSLVFQVVHGGCLTYSFWPSSLFKTVFGIFLVSVEFLIPLIILFYCYGRIIWVLSRRVGNTLGNSSSKNDTFQLARDNTLKKFILVGVCFIICLSNSQIYYLMFNLGYNTDFDGNYFKFAILMSFINCTINPFIYLVKYKDYKEALKLCFGCKITKHSEITETKQCNLSS